MTEPCLVLIDGNYYCYRFYHGSPIRLGPDGRPNHVIHAFTDLITTLRRDSDLTHWALIFDHPEPSFRHLHYAEYKAHRPPMPDDLRHQLPAIRECAEAMGIPCLSISGYEADDVLATLACEAAVTGTARICSSDKDLDQILSDRISTWDPLRNILRDAETVKKERGVRPDQIIDYLSMVGDSADNVPGIRGIGPKTAANLLNEFDTLDAVLAADSHRGKRAEAIVEFGPRHQLTRELITLVTVPDLSPIDHLTKPEALSPAAEPVLNQHGVMAARHRRRPTNARPSRRYQRLADTNDIQRLATCDLIAIAARHQGDEVIIAVAADADQFSIDAVAWTATTLPADVRKLLAAPHLAIVSDQPSLDLLATLGIEVHNLVGHVQRSDWLQRPDHDPRNWHQQFRAIFGEDLASEAHEPPWHDVCDQASCIRHVHGHHCLHSGDRADQATWHNEHRLSEHLIHLQRRGCPIQRDGIVDYSERAGAYLSQIVQELQSIGGKHFNPANPNDCATLLHEQLQLPVAQSTRRGPRVDRAVLQTLRDHHEAASLLLQFHQLSSLLANVLPDLTAKSADNGRAHLSYNQPSQRHGLPRCRDLDLDLLLHSPAIGTDPLTAILGQSECLQLWQLPEPGLQAIASVSNDDDLIRIAYSNDPLAELAAEIFRRPLETITSAQRRTAGSVVSIITAGQGAAQLATRLAVDSAEAGSLLDEFHRCFPAVEVTITAALNNCTAHGWVDTACGRRRLVAKDSSPTSRRRLVSRHIFAGTAADAIKAMLVAVSDEPAHREHVAAFIGHQAVLDTTTPSSLTPAALAANHLPPNMFVTVRNQTCHRPVMAAEMSKEMSHE